MEAKLQEMSSVKDGDCTLGAGTGFHSLDIRSVSLNRLSWLIFAVVVGAAFSIASLIVTLSMGGFGWVPIIVMSAGIIITAILLGLTLVWPRWEYDRTGWRLDEVGLQIRGGVIWRHQISVPFARVQHADVSQGPLQRQFGLGTLTVHTAGTQNASVSIEGLAHETAIEMRDKLVAQRKSGHVV